MVGRSLQVQDQRPFLVEASPLHGQVKSGSLLTKYNCTCNSLMSLLYKCPNRVKIGISAVITVLLSWVEKYPEPPSMTWDFPPYTSSIDDSRGTIHPYEGAVSTRGKIPTHDLYKGCCLTWSCSMVFPGFPVRTMGGLRNPKSPMPLNPDMFLK